MKIYTKTGDKGQTSLFGGTRVPKHHVRLEAYGTVDELNSCIGVLHSLLDIVEYKQILLDVQMTLFNVGSNLASEKPITHADVHINDADILCLEKYIDQMNEVLVPLTHFILPGGTTAAAHAHVCRTVCRRAERRVVAMSHEIDNLQNIVIYLNRLSDFFFVLSRYILHVAGVDELKWIPQSK